MSAIIEKIAIPEMAAYEVSLNKTVSTHFKKNGHGANNSRVERICRYVINAIMSGEFAPGGKINESRVAKELGLSHVPVREAMERLQHENWVQRIPNKGVYVTEITGEDILHVFQLRAMIEAEAVGLTAKHIAAKQLAEIKDVLDIREAALKSGNRSVAIDADSHFHRLLVHFADNPRLSKLHETILLQARGHFFTYSSELPVYAQGIRRKLNKADHANIYEAMKNHKKDKAVALIREHIQIGCETAVKIAELFNT